MVLAAILVSAGLVLGVIESKVPLITSIPGGKIGISNIVTLISLYIFSPAATFLIAILKSFLVSILSGGISAFLYSGSGAVFSVFTMLLAKKLMAGKVGFVGVSILGALSFNLAQVLVATLAISNINMLRYLPVLWFISAFSGLVVGQAAKGIVEAL